MFNATSRPLLRRRFFMRLSQGLAALSAVGLNTSRLDASAADPIATNDPDAWMHRLTGAEKVMIHAHEHFMTALVDARTMLANARDAYGVPESQYSLAVVTHGRAVQGLFHDDIWQRHSLGVFYKVNDPRTGLPATRNIFLTAQDGEPADAAVSPLMQRGVTFVVCNVALRNLSRKLAREGTSADTIYQELAAGLVPGVFIVPDAFVSIQRAQKRGIAYVFTDRTR